MVGLGDGEAVEVAELGLGELLGVVFAAIRTMTPCPSKKVVGAKDILGVTSRVKVRVVFRINRSISPFCKEVNRSLASKGLKSTALASPRTAAAIALQ